MHRIHLLFTIFMLALALPVQARQITDMVGRTVTVPDRITRVYSSSPPGTWLLYAVDPALMAGVNFMPGERAMKYLRPEFAQLPVLGGAVGHGHGVGMEALLKARPDIVLAWDWQDRTINARFEETFGKLGLPTVYVRVETLADYPAAFAFLGELLDRRERTGQLRSYAENTVRDLARVTAGIAAAERVPVYYAQGADGLATERERSFHARLIPQAGGRNVHRGEALDHFGMEKVSMEQVMLYNPRVILVQEREFYGRVFADPRWQRIAAVREKRVYQIPRLPFNWFDRPPSFMQLLGGKWLAAKLYPQRYSLDIAAETRAFYKLFLGVTLSDENLREILGP